MISKCPYCGAQYFFESEQIGSFLNEKEKTKQLEIQQEFLIKKEKYKFFNNHKNIIYFCIICLLIGLFFLYFHYTDPEQKLERIDSNIIHLIEKHDYDKALLEVNKLDIYESLPILDFSLKNKWKEKQKNYREEINRLKNEYEVTIIEQ